MEINPSKLSKELKNAGIQISGCDSNGKVWINGSEIQNRADVAFIISKHDPSPEINALLLPLNGKRVDLLSKADQDTLLLIISQVLGISDESNIIHIKQKTDGF